MKIIILSLFGLFLTYVALAEVRPPLFEEVGVGDYFGGAINQSSQKADVKCGGFESSLLFSQECQPIDDDLQRCVGSYICKSNSEYQCRRIGYDGYICCYYFAGKGLSCKYY